jgi:hypothetical protein
VCCTSGRNGTNTHLPIGQLTFRAEKLALGNLQHSCLHALNSRCWDPGAYAKLAVEVPELIPSWLES